MTNRNPVPPSAMRLFAFVINLLCCATLSAQIAPRVERSRIHGIDTLLLRTDIADVVTVRASLPAGDVAAKDGNLAIATLVGAMLDQGTTSQNKFEIAEQLEAVGATITFAVDHDTLRIGAKCLRQDLPLVISLVAEQLRTPAFDPDEFARVKARLAGSFQRQLESTDARARETFIRAVYPENHPNYATSLRDFLAALPEATVEEAKQFHVTHYGPQHMTLVIVGDVDVNAARQAIDRSFSGWTGGSPAVIARKRAAPPGEKERVQTVSLADKPSVSIVWGQSTGLRFTDPDALPLRVATAVFGSGFTGRLLATIRDREGLTYGIGAAMANDTFNDGDWYIAGTFAPELLERGLTSTRRELQKWYQEGVTAAELEARKSNLAGTFQLQLATTEGLATTLLRTVNRGLPVSWIDEYPTLIQAVTLDAANAAIRRYLNPDQMTLVRAGTLPQD